MSLLAALVAFLVTTMGGIYQGYATAQEPTPTPQPAEAGTQPLMFSHQLHAGEYEIACQYCHAYARRGPVAGIPSVQRCVGCQYMYSIIREGGYRMPGHADALSRTERWMLVHYLRSFAD